MKIQLGSFSIPRGLNYIPYSSATLESFIKHQPEFDASWKFERPLYDYSQEPTPNLDMLGLTCYIWSQDHCDRLAEEYKRQNPEAMIIFGGPNVPVNPEEWEQFEQERPFVDVFVAGSGEEVFLQILQNYPTLKKWYRKEKDNRKYRYPTPLIYLDGTVDEFLNDSGGEKYCAILETNRGCPFKCAYCDWGDATGGIVSKYDEKTIFDSVEKIMDSPNIRGIKIIDANWGLYERDLKLTEFMRDRRRKDFFISLCGTAKNTIKYVPEISRIFYEDNFSAEDSHSIPLKLGIQTWNETTLKYNDRGNIKTKYFDYLIEYYKQHNIPYHSELIIGLPGETPESWLETLDKDFGYQPASQFFNALEAVPNMPLLLKYKDEYQIELKAVFSSRENINRTHNRGYHRGRGHVFSDFDPIEDRSALVRKDLIKSCFSYSPEDLLKIYDYTWWMSTFNNSRLLKNIKSPSEEILEFFDTLDSRPFWKNLVEAHRGYWREAFEDGKILSSGAIRYWFYTFFRADDLMQVAENFEQAQDEMGRKMTPVQRSLRLYDYDFSL